MHKRIWVLTGTLAMTALPLAAQTQQQPSAPTTVPPAAAGTTNTAQTKDNGSLTKAEFMKQMSDYFDSMDTNHDGHLGPDDMPQKPSNKKPANAITTPMIGAPVPAVPVESRPAGQPKPIDPTSQPAIGIPPAATIPPANSIQTQSR